jgi:hypothetical protein
LKLLHAHRIMFSKLISCFFNFGSPKFKNSVYPKGK